MSHKAVFCIATSNDQVEQIVERLSEEGFANDAISVLFLQETASQFTHRQKTRDAKAWLPGGRLGDLEELGIISVPGVGQVVAAGPIATALGEEAAEGIARTLVSIGFPETEAKGCEARIKLGNSLITVHTDEPLQVTAVQEIFEEEEAEDIGDADETVYHNPRAKLRNSNFNN